MLEHFILVLRVAGAEAICCCVLSNDYCVSFYAVMILYTHFSICNVLPSKPLPNGSHNLPDSQCHEESWLRCTEGPHQSQACRNFHIVFMLSHNFDMQKAQPMLNLPLRVQCNSIRDPSCASSPFLLHTVCLHADLCRTGRSVL